MKISKERKKWNDFKAAFYKHKEKRIVLYGIGLSTAIVVSKNDCFCFVGLMDQDPANIGRMMHGLPVVSLAEAEEIADMIVINSPETYWQLIYKRIHNSKIPIYFRNGEKAYTIETPRMTAEEMQEEWNRRSVNSMTDRMIHNVSNELFAKQTSEIMFSSLYSFGYCVWGPVVYSFCEWLYFKSRDRFSQLLFLSRDGYLLKKDYDFFVKVNQLTDAPTSKYLLTSRRIAHITSMETKKDFEKWMLSPFNGTLSEYMWNRFMIDISDDEKAQQMVQMPHDVERVQSWIRRYKEQIKLNIDRDKKNYARYLQKMDLDENFALVDVGYTGTIQNKFSQFIQRKLVGFYFTCDLDLQNECLIGNTLIPCFQKEDDCRAERANTQKKVQIVESMLTAPYGMCMAVDDHLEKVCMPISKNQDFYHDRMEINRGIQDFLCNMKHYEQDKDEIEKACWFADDLFGMLLDHAFISADIRKIFYMEDMIARSRESKIFD